MNILLIVLYILYSGFVWRLRGGAWATLLHIHMGTTVTRLVSMFLLALPLTLWFGNWLLLPTITLGMWLGLVLGGYGPYMGMGDHAHTPAATWINFFPRIFGFKPESVRWDLAGMWFCGWLITMPIVTCFAFLLSNWLVLLGSLLGGTAFALVYYGASVFPHDKFPIVPGFTAREHEVFGEIGVGLFIGALLVFLAAIL